jgi:hypothetical protein
MIFPLSADAKLRTFDAGLILFTPLLLSETFTREGFLCTPFLAGLHVVAVLLDFLDDVFRLHFPLEAPESIFQRFSLLNYDFCHAYSPPFPVVLRFWSDGIKPVYRFTPKPAIAKF